MIYLLEDDGSIRNFVEYALNNSGFETRGFEKPSDFWRALEAEIPSLVLLDVMLPEEDGIKVLKKLRQRNDTARVPVIMLTARTTEYDKVLGLDSGADDYVSKPFGIMELISRIKALLRRLGEEKSKDGYTVGELYVCPEKHIVRACGKDILLTFKEFELLCLFVANRGLVFTRDQILQRIWGFEFDGENRTVDVHIRTLRQKLGECGELIETVRGIGYKIAD
ncbi:MAG: response regulator transcription factor [Ruminococcaceae bacterium]|nr:response regulator transcription factor [Oscillospiraceae bacterium]